MSDKLLACIHCGLCLEACPTYTATGNENDGPRGRIYLMRAAHEGRLAQDAPALERHLSRCLGCRACEAACPAGVEYGQLLEHGRAAVRAAQPVPRLPGQILNLALRYIWPYPQRLRMFFAGGRVLRATGLARLSAKLFGTLAPRLRLAFTLLDVSSGQQAASSRQQAVGSRQQAVGSRQQVVSSRQQAADAPQQIVGNRLQAAEQADSQESKIQEVSSKQSNKRTPPAANQLPPAIAQKQATNDPLPAASRLLPAVLLFLGCVGEGLFARVNRATERVLRANGYTVRIPPEQVCCGALHAHAGDLEGAKALARRNLEIFEQTGAELPIVTNAGGCGAMLVSYAELLADEPEYAARARALSSTVRDISQQLAATGVRQGAPIACGTTTYDASCHLLYGQKANTEPLAMLRAVPDLAFAPLNGSERCCGGAGVYNLLETELSGEILAAKLKNIADTQASCLTTGNPGCQMHLAAGASLAGQQIRVCHPVELLDESYQRAGFYK